MKIDFWRKLPTKTKRILTVVICFFLAIIITVSGILTPLPDQMVHDLGERFNEIQTTLQQLPGFQQVSFIFGNNLMICLAGFVPVIGPLFEYYVLYSTGVTITASVLYQNVPMDPVQVFFLLFVFPFTWLEFLAYSTAIAESLWLPWQWTQGKGKNELRNLLTVVSICVVMLLIAAILEVALISVLGGVEGTSI